MKIIFAGTTDAGIPALEDLKHDHEIVGAITRPDRPLGRKKIMTPPPIKTWAISQGIQVLQPEKIQEAQAEIANLAPDVMLVAAYGQIIPASILRIPKKACINLHPSLLPKYRGASPIQAALLNDDKITGASVILMDEKMDHGPLLGQLKVQIDEDDNFESLYAKLWAAEAVLLSQTLQQYTNDSLQPIPQDHTQATFVKLLSRDDARLDWTQPARKNLQKIKALNPEPGTWTTLDKKSVKIIKAVEVKNGIIDLPGKIYSEARDCLVKCGDYSLKLLLVQPEGKNPMTGPEFLNGLKNQETKIFI